LDITGKIENRSLKLAVIGLGYVGLPLAVEFGKIFDTIGFDVKQERLNDLRRGVDPTLEVGADALKTAARLTFSCTPEDLHGCDIFIVAVPTPVDIHHRPDLSLLQSASETVGKVIKLGAIVIYESTVYPGCTEEECVPLLEKFSGLKFNQDFFCGYSPERVNPGDKVHSLCKITKIVSGSTEKTAEAVDMLYSSIISAGTYRVSSIKIAEAAKVIENTQRDINIAFVNELAKIFSLIGIDTQEVLKAAGTKWNFLNFTPGLVGGHCIGVDPYYLTHKALALGYHPEVILAGRRINDDMGKYVVSEVIKLMGERGFSFAGARILQLGITFKENCPDIRNSRAYDVASTLQKYGCRVDILDPWADPGEVMAEYALKSLKSLPENAEPYDAVILTVAHQDFKQLDVKKLIRANGVVYDVKGILPREVVTKRL